MEKALRCNHPECNLDNGLACLDSAIQVYFRLEYTAHVRFGQWKKYEVLGRIDFGATRPKPWMLRQVDLQGGHGMTI